MQLLKIPEVTNENGSLHVEPNLLVASILTSYDV